MVATIEVVATLLVLSLVSIEAGASHVLTVFKDPKSLQDAETTCYSRDAALATARNEIEFADIMLAAEDVQLTQFRIASMTVDVNSGLAWIQRPRLIPVTFTEWGAEDIHEHVLARIVEQGQASIVVNDGAWEIGNRDDKMPFICSSNRSTVDNREVLRSWSKRMMREPRHAAGLEADRSSRGRRHPHTPSASPSSTPTNDPCAIQPCGPNGVCFAVASTQRPGRLRRQIAPTEDPDESSGDEPTYIPTPSPVPRYLCDCFEGYAGRHHCDPVETNPPSSYPTLFPSKAPIASTGSPISSPSQSPVSSVPSMQPTPTPSQSPVPVTGSPTTMEPTRSPVTPAPSPFPSISPTFSCETLFEYSRSSFPGALITFEPGTSASSILSGFVDSSGDSITAVSLGATRVRIRIAFTSLVFGPGEPKIALRLTNPSLGIRSYLSSGSVNITADDTCENGQFMGLSAHPSTNSEEMRTLRYGVGIADVEATIGSWAPKVAGYKLEVFLLRREWSSQSPPQAQSTIEGISLELNATYIQFQPYLVGQDKDSQRMIQYSAGGFGMDLNVSWHVPDETGSVSIVAFVVDDRCPESNCAEEYPTIVSTGASTNSVNSTGMAAIHITLKPQTPFTILDAHRVVLYLQIDNTSVAQSNGFTFRVYYAGIAQNGVADGEIEAHPDNRNATYNAQLFDSSSSQSPRVWWIVSSCVSLALILVILAVYAKRRARSDKAILSGNDTKVISSPKRALTVIPRTAWIEIDETGGHAAQQGVFVEPTTTTNI